MSDPIEVLEFWLGEIGPEGWYAGGEALDDECRARSLDLWQAAHEGGLEHWVDGTVGTLAYLVICDQLARNMHRGTDLAFATDARALAAARQAVEAGWDMGAPEPERQFFYMPFEHSENPADQELAVRLLTERMASDPDRGLAGFPFATRRLGGIQRPQRRSLWRRGAMPRKWHGCARAMHLMHRGWAAGLLLG